MNTATLQNPRAVIGSNEAPDYAREVTDRMARDYALLSQNAIDDVERALLETPAVIGSDDELKAVTETVIHLRDTAARAESLRVTEKEPFLRGGNAVDQYFKGMIEKLKKAGDEIGRRGHVYNQKKIDAEREERARVAREAARAAEEARQAEMAAQLAAEEARRAAERARKAENVAARTSEAEEAEKRASDARREAMAAAIKADADRLAQQVSSADIARQRFGETGHMATVKQVGFVEVLDYGKLDLEKLRPYLKQDHLLAAVKAYARTTNFSGKLDGATIEMRDGTVYR